MLEFSSTAIYQSFFTIEAGDRNLTKCTILRSRSSGLSLLKHLKVKRRSDEEENNFKRTLKELLGSDEENDDFGNFFAYNRQILVSSTLIHCYFCLGLVNHFIIQC